MFTNVINSRVKDSLVMRIYMKGIIENVGGKVNEKRWKTEFANFKKNYENR